VEIENLLAAGWKPEPDDERGRGDGQGSCNECESDTRMDVMPVDNPAQERVSQ
jgi:hypothetical protein